MRQRCIRSELRTALPRFVLLALLLVASVTMYGFGCKNKGGGSPGAHGTGTIVIDATPDHLDAPWGLVEAEWLNHWEGTGDYTFTEMVSEKYTISWEQVPGYTMQSAMQETLYVWPDSTVVFEQVYVAD